MQAQLVSRMFLVLAHCQIGILEEHGHIYWLYSHTSMISSCTNALNTCNISGRKVTEAQMYLLGHIGYT